MQNAAALGGLLSTLLERRSSWRNSRKKVAMSISDMCLSLSSETTETSGLQFAASILDRYRHLSEVSEPRRLELFRPLNQASGATGELVKMRENLLRLLRDNPSFARTDFDLVHLLRS